MTKTDFPTSFKDPLYASLDAGTEQKLGLPVGLLASVRTHGERSNHNAVSPAGAKTVYQFTPATRKAILDKYGIDVTLSPQNASEGAGLLLKEGMDRNQGDLAAAVGEYIGGTNRENWGSTTKAYISRVMVGQKQAKESALDNAFAKWMAGNPATPPRSPESARLAPQAKAAADALDPLADAFGKWLVDHPQEAEPSPEPKLGLLDSVVEGITGTHRRTAETDALPDWTAMPEMSVDTPNAWSSVKAAAGTLLSSPQETAQILQANFPGVQIRQDSKGNFLLKSSVNGQEYAIKPGFQMSDIPRAVGALAAFTPAGRATTLAGAAATSAATQAAIEATQSAVGGNFDAKDVALAGLTGAAVPAVVNTIRSAAQPIRNLVNQVRSKVGMTEPVPTSPAAIPPDGKAPSGSPPNVIQDTPLASSSQPPEQMTLPALVETAKSAAEGGIGSSRATKVLATQAAPDQKVVEAAKRLGVEEYLQPDHVTTSQAYRELAQAVKSFPGSEARAAELQGLQDVAKRADDLVTQIGGTHDMSQLDSAVKQRLQVTHDALKAKADALYDEVRAAIPARTPAAANETLALIDQRASELGGAANLTPMEKTIRSKLSPKPTEAVSPSPTAMLGDVVTPSQIRAAAQADSRSGVMYGQGQAQQSASAARQPTYALLDDVRKKLVAAKYGKADEAFNSADDRKRPANTY